jgi:hypothetical protein
MDATGLDVLGGRLSKDNGARDTVHPPDLMRNGQLLVDQCVQRSGSELHMKCPLRLFDPAAQTP